MVGLFLIFSTYKKRSNEIINTIPTKSCIRCNGDGKVDLSELSIFLGNDILYDINTIKYFQDFMDSEHPGWIYEHGTRKNLCNEVSGFPTLNCSGYGKFGKRTMKVYSEFKEECFKTGKCLLCQ